MSSYEVTRLANIAKAVINPATDDTLILLLPQDPLETAVRVIENEHAEIHAGNTFKAIDAQNIATSTVKYGVTVSTGFPHMHFICDVYDGSVRVDVYRDATFTSGTAMTVNNRNRNSTKTSVVTVHTGVASTNGTLIDSFYVGATGKSAGNNRAESEWILKTGVIYRVDLVGLVAGTKSIMGFNWYE